MNVKLLPAPQIKPIDKDAIIDDLKRKLAATEYQLDLYKKDSEKYARRAYEYWRMLQRPL
jgi:hypothetical protein